MEAEQQQTLADKVKSRVSAYIEGKNCRIGIILPQYDPEAAEAAEKELYRTLVEVHVRQAKRKAAQE